MAAKLQTPHGGALVNLMASDAEKKSLVESCNKIYECSDRNACDVELLSVGAFSPLSGFLVEAEYQSVVENMQLTDGTILGLPIVLDTNSEDIVVGDRLLLTYNG